MAGKIIVPDSGLESTTEELLALFTRQIENLDVDFIKNTHGKLEIIYVQRGITDPALHWDKYLELEKRWERGERLQERGSRLSDIIPSIYYGLSNYLKQRPQPPQDTLVLYARLFHMGDLAARLDYIKRNSTERFRGKGFGAEFYCNMLNLLKGKGYRFLTLIPLSEYDQYFKELGAISIQEVRPEKKHLLKPEDMEKDRVHFLYEEDKPEFLI